MRRTLTIAGYVLTGIVALVCLALIASQTPWFRNWARAYVVRSSDRFLNGELQIGRLDGNLFTGAVLHDFAITMDGERVVAARRVEVDYGIGDLLSQGIVIDSIRLFQPDIVVRRDERGVNLARLIKSRPSDPNAPKRTVTLSDIQLTDGTIAVHGIREAGPFVVPARYEDFDARLVFEYQPDRSTLHIGELSTRALDPALDIRQMGGTLGFADGNLHFEDIGLRTAASDIHVDGVMHDYLETARFELAAKGVWSLPELEGIVPFVEPYDLTPEVDASLAGPASALDITLAATSDAGNARGTLRGDFVDPDRRLEGRLTVANFDLGRLYSDPDLASDITGDATFNLALLEGDVPVAGSWTFRGPAVEMMGYRASNVDAEGRVDRRLVTVTRGQAAAYGGVATTAGTIRFADDTGRGLAVDLRGRATNVNLRLLPVTVPVPRLVTDIDASQYALRYDDAGFEGEATLEESVIEGATYAAGTTARVNTKSGTVRYGADGRVTGLDLPRYGAALDVEWLRDPRFEGALNGSFAVEGRGDSLETLALAARGTLVDSTIFGGELPSLSYDAAIVDRRLTLTADGSFRRFDGAALTGDTRYAGVLNGTIDGRVEVADLAEEITFDAVGFDGIAALEASTVGGLRIDRATFDGTLQQRAGELRRFDLAGPDLTASGSGTFDLNPGGASAIAFTATSTDLTGIGELIGQPLTGAATVDATLTGNSEQLQAAGTLKGGNVGYGDYRALDLDATFTAGVPDLDPARATGSVSLTTKVIEGLPISVADADVTASYDGSAVTFEGALRGDGREIESTGRAVLHPDHQEIHLSALSIAAGDQRWALEGGDAAIQYGRDALVLSGVTLVSGASRIEADGTLPFDTDRAVGPLRVRARSVDLAALEDILLTQYGLAGTLTADAVVTGTLSDPRADGTLRVDDGVVRGYEFTRLEGSVDYGSRRIVVDLALEQSAIERLTAKGVVPLSALAREGTGEHAEGGEQIDLRIQSTPIQLGVVQAFVPYVTDATGLAEIDLTVRGTLDDLHAVGAIGVKGGAFTVPDLGTTYTGLDTQIEFRDDQVVVEGFTLTDDNGERMRIGGNLRLHNGQVGTFQIVLESQNFEVVDNALGDVQITSLLAIEGTLAQPQLIGNVEVEAGRVEVDRVLDMLGGNAYALTPQDTLPPEGTTTLTRVEGALAQSAEAEARMAEASAEEPATPLYDRLSMNLHVLVPNNLVVRGTDIRPSGPASAPVGDLNITLGGDVRVRKARGGRAAMTGVVNTVRGTYDFQGRRFEVQRDGTVRFLGTADVNPLIDISATRDISGVVARVHLRGTLREPTLTLTSDPPLDEADILSLVIFNRPINQIGNEERGFLTDVAANYAAGIFTEQLSQSLGRALDLDLFEIQTTTAAGEVTPRITVGQQFGERLFMRFSQQFGSQQISEFSLEYELTDFLRLAGSVAEGRESAAQRLALRRVERFGLDLVFYFSY